MRVLATRSETSPAPLGEPSPVYVLAVAPVSVVPPVVPRPRPQPKPPQNEFEYPLKPANPENGLKPPKEYPPEGFEGALTPLKLLDAAA